MKVTVWGSGYVGLVTGVCLADVGHRVLCIDIDSNKIEALKNGIIPIYEPELDKILKDNLLKGYLSFSADAEKGVHFGDIQMIAVGTPPDEDGAADLQYVLGVAETIGRFMTSHCFVVNKSTVPVGTADRVKDTIRRVLKQRKQDIPFDVISNPEFLKEGAAINDFMRPDRIVIGVDNDRSFQVMRELYAPFNRNRDRMISMDIRSAELTKYAANAMLATKISFINELANIAERVGADIECVRQGIGSDSRIGTHFIYPGCGYGGSCFPKDIKALAKTSYEYGYMPRLLDAVEQVNHTQKLRLFDLLVFHFGEEEAIKGKTFGLWGLSFKPETDDMREAPSRYLMEEIWNRGGKVKAYDPCAMSEARRIYGDRDDLILVKDKKSALDGVSALLICTEWKEFRIPDYSEFKQMKVPLVFDGRNLYDPASMKKNDIVYYAIGRGETHSLYKMTES